ncbi:DUF2292 domain-containing protein [Stutzerimonas stutzeri]|uniref:DUF2292 domain-containing protein n=1 Tax=Stutzerimonas stutzeri TaxID=316 RepID=A0A2N8SVT0_STUST|nr:DUF2292 domain-containing protein [Stutzerimonas stutzeri]MCI0917432.1 YezD family protein [Stutzerimonas stutzeri]MCQ4251192.1 DUF2292 domain-containing protein [Stutzerimonas stutzeri]PNG06559.1 DUF2292 domain-containing protein [Stutzerimonas stutzeri]QUE76094.1 YezD family protein [Stutzerimonas stutzeri]
MTTEPRTPELREEADGLHEIRLAMQGLKYGSVEITLHNGQIVQIERKEKIRLQPSGKQA